METRDCPQELLLPPPQPPAMGASTTRPAGKGGVCTEGLVRPPRLSSLARSLWEPTRVPQRGQCRVSSSASVLPGGPGGQTLHDGHQSCSPGTRDSTSTRDHPHSQQKDTLGEKEGTRWRQEQAAPLFDLKLTIYLKGAAMNQKRQR